MNMALENFTYHYRPLSLNDTQYNSYCYVKEGADLKNTTSFVYSEDLCKLGFVLTLLMAICGTTLNALIVITLLKNKSIRKERFTPIVISLASCNFLFSIIVLPIKSSRLYHRDWVLGDTMCKLYPLLIYGIGSCVVWNIIAASVMRLAALHYSMKALTRKNIKAAIICSWILAHIPLIPSLFELYGIHGLECQTRQCKILPIGNKGVTVKRYFETILHVFWAVSLIGANIGILFKYWGQHQIKHSIRRPQSLADVAFGPSPCQTVSYSVNQSFFIETSHPNHTLRRHVNARIKQEKKVTSVVLTVVVVFFVTYLPIFVVRMRDVNAAITMPEEYMACMLIMCSSVIINPVVYFLIQKRYRTAMTELLEHLTNKKETK